MVGFAKIEESEEGMLFRFKYATEDTIKALEREQETKIGHWIELGNYDDWGEEQSYKCSECGDIDTYHYNYCPECGAKMTDPIDTRTRNKWQK